MEETPRTPKFPLPLGHVFGPSRHHITHHDGRAKLDGLALRRWQSRFAGSWQRPWMHPSGLFDGLTQKAVLEVQATLGLRRTGLLGAREWAAVWERTPPPPKPKPVRQPPRKLTNREKRQRRRYWRKFSQWQVEPGSDPDAPGWFPGRPFGPHSKGDYVLKVQEILGYAPTGRFSKAMARRVAGLQRVHGLPESGVVDARTAQVIEGMSKE